MIPLPPLAEQKQVGSAIWSASFFKSKRSW